MNANTRRRQLDEDVEPLLREVERAIRNEVADSEPEETVNDMVYAAIGAVRDSVTQDNPVEDTDAVIGEVQLALRSMPSVERLAEDAESLLERISGALHGVLGTWLTNAGSMRQSVGNRLRDMRHRVRPIRPKSRDHTVMIRVDGDGLKHMEILKEAGLVASLSEAAAFLISEGIKARFDLFESIEQRIEAIRAARSELERMKEELEHEVEN